MLNKKQVITILVILCFGTSQNLLAQENKQSSYKLNGLLFGDVYYVQKHHLDDASQKMGAVMRRTYLTFNATFSKHWFGRFRLEFYQSGELFTYEFQGEIKDFYIGYKAGKHKILVGRSPTRAFDLIESVWGLRYLTRTPLDLQGVSSRDVGFSASGPLNSKNTFSYRAMIGIGQDVDNNYGGGAKYMTAFTYKPTSKLFIDAYGEYEKLPGETDRIGYQLFVGYLSDQFRWGIQYSNQFRQDDPSLELVSGFVVTKIYKKMSLIGRFDRLLEPSPRGNDIDYIPFDPDSKATMFVGAVEYPISKYFTITPNMVFIAYDKNDVGVKPENDLYVRMTVFLKF